MESAEKTFTIKLSEKELGLIQYWRESCHHYNEFCPLHCLDAGTDFCHVVLHALTSQYKEQKGDVTGKNGTR